MKFSTILISILLIAFTTSIYAQSGKLEFRNKFLRGANFYYDGQYMYRDQTKSLLESESPKAFEEFKKGRVLDVVGTSFTAASILYGAVATGINLGVNYGDYPSAYDLIPIAPFIAGIVISSLSSAKYRNTATIYNREKSSDTGFIIRPAATRNGVGLVLQF